MQSGELKSGMPDEAEQENIVALVQFQQSLPERNCTANCYFVWRNSAS